MTRPVGVSAGGMGLLLAWVGGLAIARITGATPVVILLAAGVTLFVAAAIDGWRSARSTVIGDFEAPALATQGDEVTLAATVGAKRPVWVEVAVGGSRVAGGWSDHRGWTAGGALDARGVVDRFVVTVRSSGGLGLIWWARRAEHPIAPLVVAARPSETAIRVDRAGRASDGDHAGDAGAVSGEIDGIRSWREGDSEKFVHWSSSLRTGELVVHDRRSDADERWLVRATSNTDDPDAEAGGARRALERGLRAGATMAVSIDHGDPEPIADADAAARWSATAPLGAVAVPSPSWWSQRRAVEPDTTAPLTARWWAAASTFLALAMLMTALGHGWAVVVALAAVVGAGAWVSGRTLVSGEQPSVFVRVMIGLGALGGLVAVVASSGRLDGTLDFLRGPLPQVLVILILLHGFECRDRRTIRVGLGIAAVVVMYASAFRVDDSIAWWLAAWSACFVTALVQLSGPTRRSIDESAMVLGIARSGWPRRVVASGGALAATVGVLAVVPVPEGPARLTLPTLVENATTVDRPGGLAGPDGEPRDAAVTTEPGADRAPAGQAGGYTGFAQSMDTSVRGELSDEIVMRVRAPEPDFWRGQTFAEFDGRTWYADRDSGVLRAGPSVDVPPALGDVEPEGDVVVDRFVQTFHLEADMPNVVFHAYRPSQVIVDADVWTRSDGAIRASTVLPDGSVYTVVSSRPRIDAALLRQQGVIGPRLNDLGRAVLSPYLEVPASTSPETVALAAELAAGQPSTYDTVRAYEAWLAQNVEYDLNAPLPDPGEDAVHDFLFDSRLGFCEQIASAMTVMLRTQGVPSRLATGYLPGDRDQIAGVFEVKASDAHAWVEVWFPETGWQPFDPTATVPLSADSPIDSIGADLAGAFGSYVGTHPLLVTGVVGIVALAIGGLRIAGSLRLRRRRGRWGLLQDRFTAVAVRRGASAGAPNPRLAQAWDDPRDAATADAVAQRLDRVAFDPDFTGDDDDLFDETRTLVSALPSPDR